MSFDIAYNTTMKWEGGYSNNAFDTGGETFKGISRKHHPNWLGWTIIDSIKGNPDFLKSVSSNPTLLRLTKEFYKEKYWDNKQLNLELIDKAYIKLACELFDIAVNMGPGTAAKFIQRALNLLNGNGRKYPNITVDGIIGPHTLAMINTHSNEFILLKLVVLIKAKYYIDIVEANETQEEFMIGWINRINF